MPRSVYADQYGITEAIYFSVRCKLVELEVIYTL